MPIHCTPSLRVQTAPELEDAGSSTEVPLPFSEVDWICKESSSFLFGNLIMAMSAQFTNFLAISTRFSIHKYLDVPGSQ